MPLVAVVWPTARANKGGRNRVLPSDRADTSDDPHDSPRVRRQFRLKCMYVIKWNIFTMAHGYYHQRIGGDTGKPSRMVEWPSISATRSWNGGDRKSNNKCRRSSTRCALSVVLGKDLVWHLGHPGWLRGAVVGH